MWIYFKATLQKHFVMRHRWKMKNQSMYKENCKYRRVWFIFGYNYGYKIPESGLLICSKTYIHHRNVSPPL